MSEPLACAAVAPLLTQLACSLLLLPPARPNNALRYDDSYAARLDEILTVKQQFITRLQRQLHVFRKHLKDEEEASRAVSQMPSY